MNMTGVFDLETHNWTEFVVGGYFDGDSFVFDANENRFFDFLIGQGGVIYAHNGGFFDFLWVIQHCINREIPYNPLLQGSRILILKVGKTTFIDSMGILPFSLRKAGQITGNLKGEFDYKLITHNMSKALFSEMVDYLEQDCRVLWDVLTYLKSYALEVGLDLRATVGSTAYHSAAKELKIKPEKWETYDWKFSRSGYYGGRCEVYQTQSSRGYRIDRNSSYSAALVQTPVPVGRRRIVTRADAKKAYKAGYPGVYQAIVDVPKVYYPPLPTRLKYRLIFPIGKFGGSWVLNELQYAEIMNVKIQNISMALIWESSDIVLGPWCERVWNLRKNANPGLNHWLKYLLNSLTGKLGEKMEKSTLRAANSFDGQPPCCPGSAGNCSCTDEKCNGGCGGWKPIDPNALLWRKPYWRIPPNSRPQWAAYLTASARISLLGRLRESREQGVYCDTDSVYSEQMLSGNIGDELGEWKIEGEYRDWECMAPKLYRFLDPGTGEKIVKGKGFPGLQLKQFDDLAKGEKVDCGVRPQSFLTGIKKGLVWTNREIKKQTHPVDGWVGGRKCIGTRTLPSDIVEATEKK